MRLGPALLMTPDLDEAASFYADLLGFELISQDETQLVFRIGSGALHVFKCGRAAHETTHGEDAASVISFEVQDIESSMAALQARGVAFIHQAPARNRLAGLRYAAFRAPGGNVHELVQRIPPSS